MPAVAQLRVIETPELRLVFVDPTETFLIPYAVRTFLNSYEFQRRLFKFDPREPVNVLLTDFSDSGNASATSVPRDSLRIEIAPLSFAFETLAGNDRLNVIMNHELVHVATMDQTAKPDRLFRRLFGGKVAPVSEEPESMLYFFATTPRVAAPRWFHEGSAVFVDTWMAGGLGRAQSGYDEMVFRSMVRDGSHFYDPLGLVAEGTRIDFQVEVNSYLYGTRFMTWLARRYSPEQVIEWVSRKDGSRAYYSTAFRRVFGVTLEQAWGAWVEDEQAFQQKNLDLIRKYPTTSGQDLTTRALGSVSRAYYDPEARKIYAGLNYPGALSHIGAISLSSGSIERIVDIKGPVIYTVTSLAYDPDTPALFYTADNSAYRDLMRVDLTTHETRMLQKDLRVGDLVFNRTDRSIWGIRHLNGLCTLVRIPEPYKEWQRIVSWPYGTVVYDLDLSPDGTQVVMSVGEPSGKQEVRVFRTSDLISGSMEPSARFDFGTAVPNNFVFSPTGRYLYGSSYYTGASNIFRYDLETQKLDAVTNAETGFFRPIPLEQADALIVFRYTGNGFVPTRIDAKPLDDVSAITFLGERLAEERPIVKQWMVGPPSAVQFDDTIATRPYRLAGGLQSESMYPIVQGYKDTVGVGYRFNFSDPLQFNRATVTASVSPGEAVSAGERVHRQRELRPVQLAWSLRHEPRRFLRSVRPDPNRTKRVRRHRRPQKPSALRRAATPRARRGGPHRREARSAAGIPEHRRGCESAGIHPGIAVVHQRAAFARVRGRRGGKQVVGRGKNRRSGRARRSHPSTARTTWAPPCRSATRRCGYEMPLVSPRAMPHCPSPTFTSADSETIGSTTVTRSDTTSGTAFPEPSSTRSPVPISSNRPLNGICRQFDSSASARLDFTRRGCDRRFSLVGSRPI